MARKNQFFFTIAPGVRDEFEAAVAAIRERAPTVQIGEAASAALLGFAELDPAEQARWIEQLRSRDLRPLMEATPTGPAEAIEDEARAADAAARADQAASKRSRPRKRQA